MAVKTRLKPSVRTPLSKAVIEAMEMRRLFALTITPFTPGAISTLTNALVGPASGINVTDSSYIGVAGQAGTFTGFDFNDGTTPLSLGDGILLTSGLASNANGPNSAEIGTGDETPGDTDLDALISTPDVTGVTLDANVLTLTFTAAPGTQSVLFDFVFGSEEFPLYVGQFNDAFGAYLDGTQISTDALNQPFTVNNNWLTLNNSGDTLNPNAAGKTPVNYNIQYNGLTPRISTKAPLNTALATHTLKLVIADASDSGVDSGVFISNLRGSAQVVGAPTTGQPPTAEANGPYTVSGNSTVVLSGIGTDPNQAANTLQYAWDLDADGIFGETGVNAGNGNETGANPTYKANAIVGLRTVTLRVTDNDGLSTNDTATIDVTAALIHAPTAEANGPYNVASNGTVKLNGVGSDQDQSAGTLQYFWDLDGDTVFGETGAGALNGDEVGATPTYKAGSVAGPKTVTLQVIDDTALTTMDTAVINVTAPAPRTGTIVGRLWNDTNGDGQWNGLETYTGSRTVFIDDNGNGKLDAGERSTLADKKGFYTFTNVPVSTKKVTRIFAVNFRLSNPSAGTNGLDLIVHVEAGVTTTAHLGTYGNRRAPSHALAPAPGTIKGTLWNDTNGDGIYEPKYEAATGIRTVFIDTNRNGILNKGEQSTLSDVLGHYSFTTNLTGVVAISRVFPKGFNLSNASAGTNGKDVLVTIKPAGTIANLGTRRNVAV